MNTDREHSKQQTKQSRWGFRGMTVRDWLQLLIVPLALVVIGFLFTMQQDARQQKIEDQRAQQAQNIENQRAEAERELAVQRAQDEALQAYLNQMSELMLNRNLIEAKDGDSVYTLAQARTSTAISRLDADHNRHVTRFLSDSGLSGQAGEESSISLFRQIDLSGADLSGADLRGADLSGATLNNVTITDAFLAGADLRDARLNKANLSYASVFDANLRNAVVLAADLRHTDLSYSNLSGANLSSWANLIESTAKDEVERNKMKRIGANVVGAGNLSEASDLSGADLSGADLSGAYQLMPDEQISAAKTLEGATMPDGQTLKGATNPDGPTFEDWLKDKKAQGKDEKNK